MNIARPVQGWPLIVQAGASDAGRQLAAETAEVVFTSAGRVEDAQAIYTDIKGRMAKLGRDPDSMKIMPAALVVVADSVDEAQERRAKLDSLVNEDSALAALSIALDTTRPSSIRTPHCPTFPKATKARAAGSAPLRSAAARP